MEKENKKKFIKEYLITSVISFGIGIAFFLLFFFINGSTLLAAVNAASFSAIILVCSAGLIVIAREGFFDIFSYGFKQMGSMMFGKKPNANNDFASYKEDKRIERVQKPKTYIATLLISLIFVTAFIVLRIILG